MDDEYPYSVFFEVARELIDREKAKFRRHFQKIREVGGGECGMVEKVRDGTYKIGFKEKEVQERVSKKKEHTIHLQSGDFQVTVSPISPLQNPEHTHQSSSEDSQKAKEEEKKKRIHLDIFILFYLRDTSEAFRVLKKQLDSFDCSVELDFEEEEAVVTGPEVVYGGPVENWEKQVDRVFTNITETYICHHVLEAKEKKALLQDLSFVNDSIKVYTESGYVVIVGRAEAVKERLAALEENQPIQKELPIEEKTFQLVEEEFSREMSTEYPEVKTSKMNPGMLILKGSAKEVQAGASKLDDLMKKILEKRLVLPTDLITFMNTGEVISKYQARFREGLRNPVFIEVGPDLVLSSLSSDALDEAEAAILRDISVESVNLQPFSAVPQDLDGVMEALIKAKNEANHDEHRVDVCFFPGPSGNLMTNIRLVGYTDNVSKVKEVLQDYQINHITTEEVLNLPYPEVVDCFDKVLTLTGMSQTGVTLKASNVPYPSVLVSGPCSLVQKVQADLNAKLARLTLSKVVLKGPGVQWYFQGERDSKNLIANSCQVVIKEQQQTKPNQSTATDLISLSQSENSSIPNSSSQFPYSTIDPLTTVFLNQTTLEIKIGSLIDFKVNVLVAPMISKKLRSTKIGKCLHKKGGKAMESCFSSCVKKWNLSVGNVMIVDAPPSLNCSKILFIECLPWDKDGGRSMQALRDGLKRCFNLCVQQGWHSVALPVIGPGKTLKYPLKEAVRVLTEEIQLFGLFASCGSLATIQVVIKPGYPDFEECYHNICRRLSQNMNHQGNAIFRSVSSELADITVTIQGNIELQLRFGDITEDPPDGAGNMSIATDCQKGPPTPVFLNQTTLEIKIGSLIDFKVNVLVAPMISKKLHSTKIGSCLLEKGGKAMQKKFDSRVKKWNLSAGNVMIVDAPPSLNCSKIFFIECLPWDGNGGRSMQTLRDGLKKCFNLCVQQGRRSVSVPVIGPGEALKYPLKEAVQVLTEEIQRFGSLALCGSLSTIQVVIKPGYPNFKECYQDVYRQLKQNVNQKGQAIFRSVSSDRTDLDVTVGGNSTDFQKAILTVSGEEDAVIIEKLVCGTIQNSESLGYKFVEIPIVSTGTGESDPDILVSAVLCGVVTSSSTGLIRHLRNICLVLKKMDTFLAFKKGAMEMFPSAVINTDLARQHVQPSARNKESTNLSSRSTTQALTFTIVGLCNENVDRASSELRSLYEKQCSTQTFREEDLVGLSQLDMEYLKQLLEVLDLNLEEEKSEPGRWTLSGLKDGVEHVMQLLNS